MGGFWAVAGLCVFFVFLYLFGMFLKKNKKAAAAILVLFIVFFVVVLLLPPSGGKSPGPGASGDSVVDEAPLGQLVVHFIDVGQGDAILVRSPEQDILIDGGPRSAGGFVASYLQSLGVEELDLVVGTHPHEDHIGGLIAVLETFPVGEVLDPGVAHTTKTFEDYLTVIDRKDIKFTEARAGMIRDLGGGAGLEVLHPGEPSGGNLNNASVVARLTFGRVSFLFSADAEVEAEQEILGRRLPLSGVILKVGHHGSRTASSNAYLKAVNPEVAVIMCGSGNEYGHPHRETLVKLAAVGANIYRTDVHGTIIVVTDGKDYTVKYGRGVEP